MPSGIARRPTSTSDLARFFAREQVTWHQGKVARCAMAADGRTEAGEVLTNDYLVIAAGRRYLKKLPGLAEHAVIPCEGVAMGVARA
ncbi:MAG: hypothetical protein R3D59_12410 [Paracoccaceae bacterium]